MLKDKGSHKISKKLISLSSPNYNHMSFIQEYY